jgi:hypothetical protein
MTPVEGTPLHDAEMRGEVDQLDPIELARELHELVTHLDLEGTIFRSNHASNYLALAGTLPRDRKPILEALERVVADPRGAPFTPAWKRGL